MKQEQLNAIKERVAKATPGPWKVYSDEFSTRIGSELIHPQLKAPAPVITEAFHSNDKVGIYISAKDSNFIVNAIVDVPALVAEVERLKVDRERWFKRESSLQKEIERLQAIEIESDSKLCEQKKEIELLRKALEKIMEDQAPIMEGWETTTYEIARKALGGEAHE